MRGHWNDEAKESLFQIGMSIGGEAGVPYWLNKSNQKQSETQNTNTSNIIKQNWLIFHFCVSQLQLYGLYLGLLPMALGIPSYSIVWGTMASTFVTGLCTATFLTLFIVPIEWDLIMGFKLKLERWKQDWVSKRRAAWASEPGKNYFSRARGPEKALAPSSINEIVKNRARQAGIKRRITAHSWRHTCTTHGLKRVPLHQVQRHLRHKDVRTTLRYDRDREVRQNPTTDALPPILPE